jgi:hypothetical protein
MNFDRETMPGWMALPDPATLPDQPFLIDYVRSYAPPAATAPAPSLAPAPAAVAPSAAKPWNPRPPCAAPVGVDTPAVAESMCSLELARAGDVVVREIGLPASATLVTVPVLGPVFYDDVAAGVEMLLQYFGGANSESKDILSARTTPITARNLGDKNFSWLVSMMVSTAAFPNNATIPQPSLPVRLENVGACSVAALQFNTTAPPVEADFDAACGSLLSSRLPKGYAFDEASSWTPAYVFFSGQFASFFTSECWAEVTKSADEG